MEMWAFWLCLRLIMWFFIVAVIFFLYDAVVIPILFRRKFGKYPNVFVRPSFMPFLGDYHQALKDESTNRIYYQHVREEAKLRNNYDMKVDIEGKVPILNLISDRALKEYINLSPTKIDKLRWIKGSLKLEVGSLAQEKTNSKTIKRRKHLSNLLGLNSASKYIPEMLGCSEKFLQQMKAKGRVQFLDGMVALTFYIFSCILFGRDVKLIMNKKYPYENEEGQIEEVEILEYFPRMGRAFLEEFVNPITGLMPIISDLNLINPYKRNQRNFQTYTRALKDMLAHSKDDQSIWSQLKTKEDYTEDEIIADLQLYLFAGGETGSHSLVSVFYFLKKFPDSYAKLKKELNDHGIHKGADFNKVLTIDKLNELEYLSCVVKEALRFDPPFPQGYFYTAKEDITLCNVPIPKGTIMKHDYLSGRFNEKSYLRPMEFIPDRFNPESEFYQESIKSGVSPEPYSKREFGMGPRKCPGQSFGIMQAKLIVAYFAANMDYEVDSELLANDCVGFGMGGKFMPYFTIS